MYSETINIQEPPIRVKESIEDGISSMVELLTDNQNVVGSNPTYQLSRETEHINWTANPEGSNVQSLTVNDKSLGFTSQIFEKLNSNTQRSIESESIGNETCLNTVFGATRQGISDSSLNVLLEPCAVHISPISAGCTCSAVPEGIK